MLSYAILSVLGDLCKLYKIFLHGIVRIDLNFSFEAHTEGAICDP